MAAPPLYTPLIPMESRNSSVYFSTLTTICNSDSNLYFISDPQLYHPIINKEKVLATPPPAEP